MFFSSLELALKVAPSPFGFYIAGDSKYQLSVGGTMGGNNNPSSVKVKLGLDLEGQISFLSKLLTNITSGKLFSIHWVFFVRNANPAQNAKALTKLCSMSLPESEIDVTVQFKCSAVEQLDELRVFCQKDDDAFAFLMPPFQVGKDWIETTVSIFKSGYRVSFEGGSKVLNTITSGLPGF